VTDDQELYAAWQRGDARAGQALADRHYDAVLRFFVTKVGMEADELVQRTFFIAAQGGFRGLSSLRAYLFGLARGVLLEHFRGQPGERRDAPELARASCYQLDSGPTTIATNHAEQRLLYEALRRVPLDIQIALELFYWEGLAPSELATVLAVPEATVTGRLHRGRALLRETLDQLPATPEERKSVRILFGTSAPPRRSEPTPA
jgi:RNA polymerase sigma factor (sigma-70 family)